MADFLVPGLCLLSRSVFRALSLTKTRYPITKCTSFDVIIGMRRSAVRYLSYIQDTLLLIFCDVFPQNGLVLYGDLRSMRGSSVKTALNPALSNICISSGEHKKSMRNQKCLNNLTQETLASL